MSDLKKAQLALAKFEAQVDQAGLHMIDGPIPGLLPGTSAHEIYGTLNGTHALTASHNVLNQMDVFDFTVSGNHNFDLTIHGFQPQTYNGAGTPSWDGVHDLLEFNWDPSSGVSTLAQAQAAEHAHFSADGHDVLLDISAPHVHGTITFAGLGDYFLTQPGDHWGWHNHFLLAV